MQLPKSTNDSLLGLTRDPAASIVTQDATKKNGNAKISTLLTSEQLSEILGVSTKTLNNWRYKGLIPYAKINGLVRYDEEQIQEWIKNKAKEFPNAK